VTAPAHESRRATRLRRGALLLVALVLCLYLGVLGWLKWNEVEMIYRPVAAMAPIASDLGLSPERVEVQGADARTHPLWVFRSRVADVGAWVIFLHGNGANVSTPMNVARYHQLTLLGMHVVAVEYPGYGASPGIPSEPGMVAAGTAAWSWLTRDLGVAPERVAIYGWSLGSGAATQVAADVNEAALVLEGAFTSVADRAAEVYPYLPVRWLIRHPFASRDRIARVDSPVLLLHARDDEIVPFSHAERLHEAARGARHLVPLSGGHIYPNLVREDDYLRALHDFLGSALDVRLSPPPRSMAVALIEAAERNAAARQTALALLDRATRDGSRTWNAASYALQYAARHWQEVDPAGAAAIREAATADDAGR